MPPSEVWGDGEQTRTYLYVDDCVDALVRLASVTSGGAPAIVNIGSDHLISVNALAEMALRVAGVRQDVAVAHTPERPRRARLQLRLCTRRRAAAEEWEQGRGKREEAGGEARGRGEAGGSKAC